ncbi:MAG: ABC transporter substrate-binding protein [Anaerolineales bacterium]|nr:ABC transporter substrate-binding protein [Anaerolineales bacterium]
MKRNLFILSLFVLLTLIATACGPAAPATDAPAAETEAPVVTEEPAPTEAPAAGPIVLKYASAANITTWDPIASFSTEAAYMANMYEQLLRVNPPGSAEEFTPLLAESWEKSEDGLVWTFHLRDGVKFHDGEPMNADAVKKSIDAAKDHAGASFIWLPLASVDVVDDLTVTFTLSYAQPLELIVGSEYAAYIVSPKALDAAAADENYWSAGLSAGTGPYMIESYTADQELVLTQNTEYWGGWEEGQYEKVLVTFVPEATTRQQLLEGGEVDLVTSVPADSFASFAENPDYTTSLEPALFNYTAFFNTLKAPLDDVKVRQALSYAIPYEDIIALGANGRGTQSRGTVPAGVFPYSEDVPQYTYDIEKAKTLLKEAGHEGGGFSLRLTYASENATEETFAPLIKDSFAQIGVEVTIEALEFTQQWELAKTDPATAQDIFLLLYWPTYSDAGADNMYSMFYGGAEAPYLNVTKFNLSYWKNDQYNALMDEAGPLSGTDVEASRAKYTEAQKLLVEEAPAAFLFDTMVAFVNPNHVEGFQYNLNYPDVRYWFYELRPVQ